MAVIRIVRFKVASANAGTMLARRGKPLDAVRQAFSGPTEARQVRVDDETWAVDEEVWAR